MIRSAFAPIPGFFDQPQVQFPPRAPIGPVSPTSPIAEGWPAPAGPSPYGLQPAYVSRNQDGNGRQQAQPANARIVIEVDGKVVGERQLNKSVLTIGRLSGNDIRVPSQRVSRLHARIRWENGAWVIEDAESLNGLVYQSNRIDRHILTNGDRIYVSPTAVLQFVAS